MVDQVSLEVPKDGIYGFLGPNGAGKSTTMKMLLGLIRPDMGSIEYLGQDFAQCRSTVLPSIGSLIEGTSYYPHLTGRENLRLAADSLGAPRLQVEQGLRTVELERHGDKKAGHYSMGMKQRLGIAMALLGDPFLLMLDEPTNGLDPAGVVEMRQLIMTLARERGLTVIVSSHNLSEIEQMADTVGIICAGTLRFQGPLEGLRGPGSTVIRCSDVPLVEELLHVRGLSSQIKGAEVLFPLVSDQIMAELIRDLVGRGPDVYRVERRHRSLEEAFLAITESNSAGALA
ncbi:ABC transporter ATP-binding protein [Austwickia chelonae]|uniref:ABC transporter ATP-binding protein n=1 Tax=Austwickia chelonae TaxID=100225 RepID=UPI001C3F14D9|nr:ABC transporter ATP-binding protein [Austwickia chelonae]